jgi:hypothetical protein
LLVFSQFFLRCSVSFLFFPDHLIYVLQTAFYLIKAEQRERELRQEHAERELREEQRRERAQKAAELTELVSFQIKLLL